MARLERGKRTRERILEAATLGFAEKGYEGTSVAEICRRAEVSKGAFYHHFASKQAVFLALLERWLGGLDEELAALRADRKPVPDELIDMTEMVRRVFQAAGDQLPIFLEFWAQAAHDPTVWQATITPYRRYHEFFSQIVSAGIREGSLRSVDPDTAAHVIVSLAVGLVLQGLLDPEGADWGQVTERAMRMLLEGMERKG